MSKPTKLESERHGLETYIVEYPERADLRRRLCRLRLEDREQLTDDEIARAFPEYPGVVEVYTFLSEAYTAAIGDGTLAHLENPTRLLHEKFPECPCSLFFRANILFHTERVDESHRILKAAEDLVAQYDYLLTTYSIVLREQGQEQQAKNIIRRFFTTYEGDLWRSQGFLAKQADAVERRIPPILIVTLPKSGSVFLLNTLMEGLSLPSSYLCPLGMYYDFVIEERTRDVGKGGCIVVDHIRATGETLGTLHRHGIRKIVFHYRDARQAALSWVHHSTSDEVTAVPRARLLRQRANFDGGFEAEYKQYLSSWMEFLSEWATCLEGDDRFEILVTGFDDLEAEEELFGRILDFYAIPRDKFDWRILATGKQERAGHYRKGLKDEWREVLSAAFKADIEAQFGADTVMERLEHHRKARRWG